MDNGNRTFEKIFLISHRLKAITYNLFTYYLLPMTYSLFTIP